MTPNNTEMEESVRKGGKVNPEEVTLGLVAWSLAAYAERCGNSTDAAWAEAVMDVAAQVCGRSSAQGRSALRWVAGEPSDETELVVVWRPEVALRDLGASVDEAERAAVGKLLRDIHRRCKSEARESAVLKDAAFAAQLRWCEIFDHEDPDWSDVEDSSEEEDSRRGRWVRVSLAAAGGGLALAVSGGAAAPSLAASIAATVSLGAEGLASCITGVFGVVGASVAGIKARRRYSAVDSRVRLELARPRRRNGSMFVLVPGWAEPGRSPADAWGGQALDRYDWFRELCGPGVGALVCCWSQEALGRLHTAMRDASLWIEARDRAARGITNEVLRRTTLSACSIPIAVLDFIAQYLDEPWSLAVKSADAAGVALAHKLIARSASPATLVGYSVGARMVMRCLEELHDQGRTDIVENALLLGAPLAARPARFVKARAAVAGRLVNAYSTRDWMLKLVYRTKAWSIVGVAGAQPVPSTDKHADCPGLENLDLSDIVNGHLAYPHVMPQIFAKLRLLDTAPTIAPQITPSACECEYDDDTHQARGLDDDDDDDDIDDDGVVLS